MKGAIVPSQGGEPLVTDTLTRPTPGPGQILVKSLYLAINPVDAYMAYTGILIQSWPLVLGVDASGIVVSAHESVTAFNPGDYVCGCTRLGDPAYAAGQEYFLMDAAVTVPKPSNISVVQAATLGVGFETAAFCVFEGLNIDLVNPEKLPQTGDEWAVVLGGASSVGFYAIQLLRLAGFNVLASCSERSSGAVKGIVAGVEVFDYKKSTQEQLETVLKVTGGKLTRVFDAVASEDPVLTKELFRHDALKGKQKFFATTNDWSGIKDFEGGKTYNVELGDIGKADANDFNGTLERYIPVLVKLVEADVVKVGDYETIGDGGFEDVVKAYAHKNQGASGLKKVVVKVQDE